MTVNREIDLSAIPVLDFQPFSYSLRYDKETRRLFLWGDNARQAITSALWRRDHPNLEAVIHEAPGGLITILRGRRLAERISSK
jgi:hypothetical protein